MAESVQDEKIFSPPNPNLDYKKLYIPLAQTSKRIRLLELLPGKKDEPISCRLLQDIELPTHNESCSIPFEALSYCAGDANDYVQILVDGLEFNSFATLAGALKVFRFENHSRILWADQICINQIDFSERGHQVVMMRDIYSAAATVLVWTGKSCTDSKSHLVFELITTFLQVHGSVLEKVQSEFVVEGESQDAAVKRWVAAFFNGQETTISFLSSSSSDQVLKYAHDSAVKLLCNPDNLVTWIALESFLSRPYWTRIWIVQEIVLSSNALIYCGPDNCRLLDFVSVMASLASTLIEMYRSPDRDWHRGIPVNVLRAMKMWSRHAHSIFNIWSRFQSRKPDILENLELTQHFSSADPRDRIYALLGLLSEEDRLRLNILIDYSQGNSPLDTLVHVANAWIRSGGGLEILKDLRGGEVQLGLPSWVPNFLQKRSVGAPLSLHGQASVAGWKACGPTQVRAELHNDGRTLSLAGILVGEMGEDRTLGAVDTSKNNTEHVNLIHSWQSLLRAICPEPSPEVSHEFWRTLSTDQYAEVRNEEDPPLWESLYTSAWLANEWKLRMAQRRRFCIIPNGPMGMFPEDTQPRDLVVIFLGGRVPYVIRRRVDAPMFHLIGECYVSGIMDGAAVTDHLKRGGPLFDVRLS